jgi:hypothetical protein
MTVTADLLAFLKARLDEDEGVAKGLMGLPATSTASRTSTASADQPRSLWQRFNPARVLAEVEMKRRVLDRHPGAIDGNECPGCGCDSYGAWVTGPGQLCPEQIDMALPFTDHPDYRRELPDAT